MAIRNIATSVVLTSLLAATSPAVAASSQFALEYRVERADAGRLTVPACLKIAEATSASIGYVSATRQIFPGKLAVFASGPRGGGASLTVYCIAVDRKTAYVAQALDYNRQHSAAARRAVDAVHQALLKASR